MSQTTLRLIMADDHAVARRGLRVLLEEQPDLRVVGEAGDGAEALELARAERPDVAVLDVRMPTLDGVRACKAIKQEVPETQVLILSAYEDDRYVFGLLEAGATGYVLKDAPDDEIIAAVRAAGRREPYLTSRLQTRAATRSSRPAPAPHKGPLGDLTPRELEVLTLMAAGLDNVEIAERLFVSKVTVQNYTSSIYSKLDVNTRAKAILYAMQHGLVEPAREA
jgi:DNA-binding NarL/FixJ family response regulator